MFKILSYVYLKIGIMASYFYLVDFIQRIWLGAYSSDHSR